MRLVTVAGFLGLLLVGCRSNQESWKDDPALSRINSTDQFKPRPGVEHSQFKQTIEIDPPQSSLEDTGNSTLKGEWPRYPGRHINLVLHKSDLHNAFRIIAEVSKLNLVVADEVKGEISISLKNVPWTRALSAILSTKALVAVREGNLVRILRQQDWLNETRD